MIWSHLMPGRAMIVILLAYLASQALPVQVRFLIAVPLALLILFRALVTWTRVTRVMKEKQAPKPAAAPEAASAARPPQPVRKLVDVSIGSQVLRLSWFEEPEGVNCDYMVEETVAALRTSEAGAAAAQLEAGATTVWRKRGNVRAPTLGEAAEQAARNLGWHLVTGNVGDTLTVGADTFRVVYTKGVYTVLESHFPSIVVREAGIASLKPADAPEWRVIHTGKAGSADEAVVAADTWLRARRKRQGEAPIPEAASNAAQSVLPRAPRAAAPAFARAAFPKQEAVAADFAEGEIVEIGPRKFPPTERDGPNGKPYTCFALTVRQRDGIEVVRKGSGLDEHASRLNLGVGTHVRMYSKGYEHVATPGSTQLRPKKLWVVDVVHT